MSSVAKRFEDWEIGTINSDGVPIRSDGNIMSHAELARPPYSQIEQALDVSYKKVPLTVRRSSVPLRILPNHIGFAWNCADTSKVSRRSKDRMGTSQSLNFGYEARVSR